MYVPVRFASATVLFLASLLPVHGSTDLTSCPEIPDRESRADCFRQWAAGATFSKHDRTRLDSLIEDQPGVALEALAAALTRNDLAVGTRADLLSRRGEALAALGRHGEAVAAFEESLAAEDGFRWLNWHGPEGEVRWRATLGPGAGRHLRLARALVDAGRSDEARPLLRGALAAGAGEAAESLWSDLGGGAVPGLDATPTILSALKWYPFLTISRVEQFDATPMALRGADDLALVLDFWATWCEPCAKELPRLQELLEAERERGLRVVTVNMDEPEREARAFAERLGLRMPIVPYSDALHDALQVDRLPTVFLVDRDHRIRGSWKGYKDGVEEEIAARVREVLDDAEPREELADVLVGGGRLEVRWTRRTPRAAEGVAGVHTPDGARFVVATAKALILFDAVGNIAHRTSNPRAAGVLRARDLNGDGLSEVVGFRRGSDRLATLDIEGGSHHDWQVAAPVLDVALAASRDETAVGEVLVATTRGALFAGLTGEEIVARDDLGEVVALFAAPRDGGVAVMALIGSRPTWLDRELRIQGNLDETGRGLAHADSTDAGFGLISGGVAGTAVGNFLGGAGAQLAVATWSGQLVVIDLGTGEVLHRSLWGGLDGLSAVDLTGDGLDELALISGHRVHVVGAPR